MRNFVHSDAMKMQAGRGRSSNGFARLGQLRKLCEYEQVAAVCYRVGNAGIEFLLIRTRSSGRWTFPKGSAEPGLTHAQAAALEAFEEAGVHGRIEELPFAKYIRHKRIGGQGSATELAISAHLCEVSRLGPAQEARRNRTWFAPADARRSLCEGRERPDAAQFARVVDKAVKRILRLRSAATAVPTTEESFTRNPAQLDALRRVQFEALPASGWRDKASIVRGRLGENSSSRLAQPRREVLPCEILEFSSSGESSRMPKWLPAEKKTKALGTGAKS